MPVQCPKCNSLNNDAARFCSSCGFSLISSSENHSPSVTVVKQQPRSSSIPPAPPERIHESVIETVEIPRRLAKRLKQPWGSFVVFVFLLALVTLAIAAGGAPAIIILTGPLFFLSWLVFLVNTKPLNQGVVTYLHAWQGPQGSTRPINPQKSPNWAFNFQQTDRHWQPLKDREGLLLPVTEVEFRVEEVHGSPLEEGSQIILEGLCPGRKSRAVQIWNLSPSRIPLSAAHQEIFKGQVTNWDYPRSAPDTRYPGQRSIEIWNFRLRRVDTQGNLLPSVPVEIRAESIEGTLRNGDEVEVHGQIVGGILYAREVKNLSLADAPEIVVRGWAGVPMT